MVRNGKFRVLNDWAIFGLLFRNISLADSMFFFHWNPLGKFGVLTLMKSSVLPALICGNSTSFYNLFYNKAYTQHYILAGDKQDHVFPLPGLWPPENLSHGHEFLLDKIEKAQ